MQYDYNFKINKTGLPTKLVTRNYIYRYRAQIHLYTSIPHHSLKNSMKQLIEETKRGKCFWSTDNKYGTNVSVSQLLDMVNYLVDNVYISVGNKVFRQCIGIPVHPYYIANLYVFHFERFLVSAAYSESHLLKTLSSVLDKRDSGTCFSCSPLKRAFRDFFHSMGACLYSERINKQT